MFKCRKEMQILSAGEYPLNVLMFMGLFIRMVHGGPSRALICYPLTKKKLLSHGYLQGDLRDCGQAQLRSLTSSCLE